VENTVTMANIFASAFNSDNNFQITNLPEEIQKKIKALTGTKVANAGFSNVGGLVTIADAEKAKAFIEKSFSELIKEDEEDFDGERIAKAWLKNDKETVEAQRGDDVPMLVRDIVIRRSRADRGEIFGIGLRGVETNGKGIKLSLNRQYLATIIANNKDAKLTAEEIITWGEKNLKGKWCVLGTLISKKGETGYWANAMTLSDFEKDALERAGKEQVRRNTAGAYGFVHQMDGIRYNLAGVCDGEEAEVYNAQLEANNQAIIQRKVEAEKGKGVQEGLAYALHAKLSQLALMLDAKLITRKEYDNMRTLLLAAGL
jgi:hypothetical protein